MSVPADPQDPRDPHGRDEERELDEFARLLDRAAADEAAALAEGRALPADQVPGLERVESILAALWAGADAESAALGPAAPGAGGAREAGACRPPGTSNGRTGILRWSLPLAAAALLAVVLWWMQAAPVLRPGDDLLLGGAALELVEPTDSRLELPAPLRWKVPPGAEGWTYRVRALDPAGSHDEPPLAQSPRLGAPHWTLPASPESAAWPRELLLEIEAWDASGQPAAVLQQAMRLVVGER